MFPVPGQKQLLHGFEGERPGAAWIRREADGNALQLLQSLKYHQRLNEGVSLVATAADPS